MTCPLPRYWMCHIAVALLVAAAAWSVLGLAAGLFGGALLYVGREFTQWESGKPFDWPGFLAPVCTCLGLLVAHKVLA